MIRRVARGTRDERGATAIIVALVSVVLFGAAALGVDIANLTMERQELHDAVDAAAQAAAFDLPATTAATTATTFAKFNDPDANPTSKLYCVIAANSSNQPSSSQVPTTCDPDGTGVYVGGGWSCAGGICAKPCSTTSPNAKCNTVRVEAKKDVPFLFAPVIGYDKGNTGAVVSAACKGSCGAETPNPLDVVVVADRTLSLSDQNRSDMKSAIKDMLKQMDPTMHFLAFGTIHKSETISGCVSGAYDVATPTTKFPLDADDMNRGVWVPTDFSKDYVTGAPGARAWKTTDPVYKAIDCLPASDADYGTHLAAPMKEAARKLLGYSSSNLATLTAANPRPGDVRKVIIFETDGEPNEKVTNGGSTAVDGAVGDPRSTNGVTACQNLVDVAASAKAKNIIVITIGFGGATTARCEGSGSRRTKDVLAEAASPGPSGASTANSCTGADVALENTDGDYFFCSATGSDFKNIFLTALSQVQKGIKLVKLP